MSELLEYKCPCCSGAIEFDSSLQKMKCPFCDTEFDVETLKSYDNILKSEPIDNTNSWTPDQTTEWNSEEQEGIISYVCNSCGGEIIGDINTAATSCPFCGNPVVMSGNLSGSLKPDYIIPFKLDKEAAKDMLTNHLKGKRLLPRIFKSENHIDEIKGLYVPFWLFDANTNANIRYKATRVSSWEDSRYIYTQTSFFSVLREGAVDFNNIPVDGSSKMPDDLMESIEPYDMSQAVDFQTAYLAGYLADKYDVTSENCVNRVNARIKQSAEDTFASTVKGFTSVVPEKSNINISDIKTKYALLPVWILNTTWKGKKYLFAMNGQTGKFTGDLPIDNSAYLRWLLLITGIVALAVYGGAWLFHLGGLI